MKHVALLCLLVSVGFCVGIAIDEPIPVRIGTAVIMGCFFIVTLNHQEYLDSEKED